ncbi:hypothetical protein [Halorarum salinum]|uniref:Uncharacterized protein n=1 Tax=Halorarum salinum TaxID=2743089 RepID=A0A7D5LDE6_9EURY|nr:hypothetical protein [Halobaculum salinum]QLG63335.1 hypothetical protein HUG12_16990 [Halobaculum salinum]
MAKRKDEVDDDLEEVSRHVHLTISKRKKKVWLEQAEEHHRGNLSAFIEETVDKALSGVWILKEDEEEETDGVEVNLSGLDEDIDGITDQLAAIQEQLDTLSGGGVSAERLRGNELQKFATRVHDTLPLVSGTDELVDLKNSGVTLPENERAKLSGTVDDITAHLEEDPIRVWQACLFLEHKEDLNIYSVIDEGERRWYELKPEANR